MRNDPGHAARAGLPLPLLALRYAARELPADEAARFEDRLATDPAAQDALAEAVRLSARALGQDPPAPDPLVRAVVARRLRPAATRIGRLLGPVFRRRPYRGHPLTWAGVGAGVAAGVLGFGVWLGDPDRPAGPGIPDASPRAVHLPPADPGARSPLPDMNRTAATPDPTPPAGRVPNRAEGGGGGEVSLPLGPTTTFLPPAFGPMDPLRGGTPGDG